MGSLLMVAGAATVVFGKTTGLNHGDFLILLACMAAPVGNYYQQKLRKVISSEAILFGRNLITLPFMLVLAWLFREKLSLLQFQQSFWFLLVSGFLLLGLSKLLWIEGIHRISVTKAVALESAGPLFTLFFAYLFLHQKPTSLQLLAFIPLAAGLLLLTYKKSSPVAVPA